AASKTATIRSAFEGVGVVFPGQGAGGTHVNISGAGVLKNAPNRANAIKFLEYLTSEAAQKYFANGNNEYPAVSGVDASSVVEALGDFEEDTLNVAQLGQNQAEAIKIFDRVGWP
ncbi:MAG: extracellular solute-binding protein, partial [Pseudomonadota bacterium]